jgi:hypothetical protein
MKNNSNSKTSVIGGSAALFLAVAMLFLGTIIGAPQYAYAQANATTILTSNATSPSPSPSQNTTATTITNNVTGVTDFRTLRDQYLAQWQQLNFQSSFDTFIEPYSYKGYGVYRERPSDVFTPDTSSIALYVEPVGYGFKEGVDAEGNILYSFNFTATITISDNQGNTLIEPIPAKFDEPLNSHNKATEAFLPITFTLEQPLPVGQYTIAYDITDGASGESFQIVKDIRVAEIIS